MFAGEQVGLVDDDQVRLLQLLAVNVENLLRKLSALGQTEDALRAHRIDQHAERRDGEVVAVNAAQRIRHSGHEVRATAHRLRDEHVGPGRGGKFVRGIDERIKPAAEAAAGNLLHGKALRFEHGGIDEMAALVVGDQPDAQALIVQMPRELRHGGRLARAKEAADHDVAGRRGALGDGVAH